jgi:signal transduction histidine kinase
MTSSVWSHLSRDRRLLFAAVIGVVLCLTALDFATWIELDVASIYGIPLVLAAATRSRTVLWTLTVLLALTTFAVYALQIPPGVFTLHESYFVNRVLDVIGVLLTAALLDLWIKSVAVREAQVRLLAEQNAKLEAANRELVASEAQIAQQNAELEQRRREAEEASGRKTRLLASASHDIRTPVNSIQLMAGVLRRTAADPALVTQVPGMAERLQTNALSLLELVSEMLDIASFDSGRIECHDSRFPLGDLVTAKCDDLQPLAQAKALRLDIDVPAKAIWLDTDRMKLGRIISNLLVNAIKFTTAGSVGVRVAIAADGGADITVCDTGPGIAPERLESLFDDHVHASHGAGEPDRGWGLGLAICRRLVALLGGAISAQSSPDQGSAFTVHLPASCVVDHAGALYAASRPAAAA